MTIQVEFKPATTAQQAHHILAIISHLINTRYTSEDVIATLISPTVYNVASVANQIAASAAAPADITVSCDEWADVRGFTIKR